MRLEDLRQRFLFNSTLTSLRLRSNISDRFISHSGTPTKVLESFLEIRCWIGQSYFNLNREEEANESN